MQITFQACSKTRFGSQNETWKREGFPSRAEQHAFQKWAKENKRNTFGDPEDTMYTGGSPLFDESIGRDSIKLYEYLLENYPAKPWLRQ